MASLETNQSRLQRRPASLFAALLVTAALARSMPAFADDLQQFQTPSGNIHCAADAHDGSVSISCEIKNTEGAVPVAARPKDCDAEWGQRFEVTENGPATLVCYGDTLTNAANPTLPYGQTFQFQSLSCVSTEAGLRCVNAKGRGFSLSKAEQSLF